MRGFNEHMPIAEEDARAAQVQSAITQVETHYREVVQPRLELLKQVRRFTPDSYDSYRFTVGDWSSAYLDVGYWLRRSMTTVYYYQFSFIERIKSLNGDYVKFTESLSRYNQIVARLFTPLSNEEIQKTAEFKEIRDSIVFRHQNETCCYHLVGGGVIEMPAYDYVTSGRYPNTNLEAVYTQEALEEYRARHPN
jgi:hypothetical protein